MSAVLIAKVTDVHCTNCGADWWTKVAALATLLGLLIAMAALIVARNAANAADESLKITRDQLDMAKEEHDEFLRRLGARAEIDPEFDPGHDPDATGYIRVSGITNLRAKLTLHNKGGKGLAAPTLTSTCPTLSATGSSGGRTRQDCRSGESRSRCNPGGTRMCVLTMAKATSLTRAD
jgi:hypothetical protein